MPTFNFKRRAAADLEDIAEYVGQGSFEVADRFRQAVQGACALLAQWPGSGGRLESENPQYQDVRIWPIKGFENYLICYHPVAGGIDIHRIIHAAQDVTRIFR